MSWIQLTDLPFEAANDGLFRSVLEPPNVRVSCDFPSILVEGHRDGQCLNDVTWREVRPASNELMMEGNSNKQTNKKRKENAWFGWFKLLVVTSHWVMWQHSCSWWEYVVKKLAAMSIACSIISTRSTLESNGSSNRLSSLIQNASMPVYYRSKLIYKVCMFTCRTN